MRVLILNGSMRRGENTDTLLQPLVRALREGGARTQTLYLAELDIGPCLGCYTCQDVLDGYGCVRHDDMYEVAGEICEADCILLATPIYTWYCTAPMKAMLDRHYGLNKYYGVKRGGSLWAGKRCGVVATCGYEIADGTGPFVEGIQRLCEHSGLHYIGMLAERDVDNRASFETPQAVRKAEDFARVVLAQ